MSENQDNLPTLASLRARRGQVRAPKRPSSQSSSAGESLGQAGFLFDLNSVASESVSSEPSEPAQEAIPAPSSPHPVPERVPQRPALAERRIWSVRALVADIRQHIETNYTDLWVEGEISNCRIAPSGHVYFTLKDGEAQLPVVLFRRQALLLRFRPADGLAVLVRGARLDL